MNATTNPTKTGTDMDALISVISTTLATLALLALIAAILTAEALGHMTGLFLATAAIFAAAGLIFWVTAKRSVAPARATMQ